MNQSSYKPELESIHKIQSFVKEKISSFNFDEGKLYKIELIIEEVVVNIINYGLKDVKEGFINIKINITDENLIIEISDNGIAFNPLEKEAPDFTLSIDKKRPGGLGIFLVKEIAKDIQYVRQNKKNCIQIFLDI